MKTTNYARILGAIMLIALLVTGFYSCTKDDTGALSLTGTANVMIVNGAEGSSPQDYYSDNTKLNSSAVAYGQNTSYMGAAAGNHTGQFRTSGSSTVTASSAVTFESGKYYTVYLSGSGSSSSYFKSEDDMSAPPSGKAKIRFVHLSSAITAGIDVAVSGSSKIVSALAYQSASAYNTVDANTAFTISLAGSSSSALTIPASVQSGKIYTVFISGATAATLSFHLIAQN